MKFCVIIPSYNEAATIGSIIQAIRRKNNIEVIVVDDGSVDNTAQISHTNGAVVLINDKNLGKGLSLIRGLKYGLENDYDAVITMDGDGQHSPDDIDSFIQKTQVSDAGIIIGNRMDNPRNMPLIRVLTNRFMSWFISKVAHQKIPDTQCGFRLLRKELISKLKFTTRRFETESEILIQASRLGYKVDSVPIDSIYQKEKSQINPFTDTIRFIIFIIREIWTMPR